MACRWRQEGQRNEGGRATEWPGFEHDSRIMKERVKVLEEALSLRDESKELRFETSRQLHPRDEQGWVTVR